jgi:hypothetical protein
MSLTDIQGQQSSRVPETIILIGIVMRATLSRFPPRAAIARELSAVDLCARRHAYGERTSRQEKKNQHAESMRTPHAHSLHIPVSTRSACYGGAGSGHPLHWRDPPKHGTHRGDYDAPDQPEYSSALDFRDTPNPQ